MKRTVVSLDVVFENNSMGHGGVYVVTVVIRSIG